MGNVKEYKLRSVFSFTVRAPFLQDGCHRLWCCNGFRDSPCAQDADRMRIVESNDVGLSFGSPFKLTWAYMGQSGQVVSLLLCAKIGQVAACGGQIPIVYRLV